MLTWHWSPTWWFYILQLADEDAVVILEKTPFTEDTMDQVFKGSTLKLDMKNYIYSTYQLQASPHYNGMDQDT